MVSQYIHSWKNQDIEIGERLEKLDLRDDQVYNLIQLFTKSELQRMIYWLINYAAFKRNSFHWKGMPRTVNIYLEILESWIEFTWKLTTLFRCR